MAKNKRLFIKVLSVALLCVGIFLIYFHIKNYTTQTFGTIYSGQKYSIAGENTQGLCQLINGQECQKQPMQIGSELDQVLCEINQNCTESKKALNAVLSGSVDLASVASEDVKLEMNVKALLHLTTDQKMLLISRKDFLLEDGLHVVKSVHDLITSVRNGKNPYKRAKALNIFRFGVDALERYIKFDKGYTIHPGLARYYMPRLETPLTISGESSGDCEPDAYSCGYVSGVLTENYNVSNRIARMGKGVIPYLAEAIKSDNDFLVMKATHAMARIWPREPDILTPILTPLLNHPNDEVKEQAVYALSSQKPLHSDTVARLIELAESDPVQREGFSDGRRGGRSQSLVVLKQWPLSELAAYGLARTESTNVLPVFYRFVKSQGSAKQFMGIKAIDSYLYKEQHKIGRGRVNMGELKKRGGYSFSEGSREAIAFLENEHTNLTEENKKFADSVLSRHPFSDSGIKLGEYPKAPKKAQKPAEVYDLLYSINAYYGFWW